MVTIFIITVYMSHEQRGSAMKKVLIIYHSQSSRSLTLALACYRQALVNEHIEVEMHCALMANSDHLMSADLTLFIMPENFSSIAGGMKEFLDRVFYPLIRQHFQALPYSLIISAGNDGSFCQQRIETILKGLSAKQVQPAVIHHGPITEPILEQCRELTEGLCDGLLMGIF